MLELVPISITFASLAKVILILGINMLLGYTWYSSYAFLTPWLQAMQWKEGDEFNNNKALLMSNIGTLFNSFLLHILLIAFDIRKQQWISAILSSAILTGFYAFNGWNHVFYSKKSDYQRHLTLYLIDTGYMFVLYALISLVLVGF